MHQILFPPLGEITALAQNHCWKDAGLLLRGWEGGREKEGRIEEGKGRKGRERNVAFHHLLLSNLTTDVAYSKTTQNSNTSGTTRPLLRH